MARVRVYLITYKRNQLLKRAIESLLKQSFRDWVCEVHNDDPTDENVGIIVRSLNDKRFAIVNHPENFGAIKTYNLVFRAVDEEYVSMLHDDNWWEPDFLQTMVAALDERPNIKLATANQRVWQEEEDGSWTDTGRTVRRVTDRPSLYYWPHKCQIMGAVHADGALLMRPLGLEKLALPENMEFGMTESLRERAFSFPIILVGKPLGSFSRTRDTARSKGRADFHYKQLVAAGSFFRHFSPSPEVMGEMMREERNRPLRRTNTFVSAALFYPGCFYLIKYLRFSDWVYFIASSLKRPLAIARVIRQLRRRDELFQFVDKNTAERAREAHRNGIDDLLDA